MGSVTMQLRLEILLLFVDMSNLSLQIREEVQSCIHIGPRGSVVRSSTLLG